MEEPRSKDRTIDSGAADLQEALEFLDVFCSCSGNRPSRVPASFRPDGEVLAGAECAVQFIGQETRNGPVCLAGAAWTKPVAAEKVRGGSLRALPFRSAATRLSSGQKRAARQSVRPRVTTRRAAFSEP